METTNTTDRMTAILAGTAEFNPIVSVTFRDSTGELVQHEVKPRHQHALAMLYINHTTLELADGLAAVARCRAELGAAEEIIAASAATDSPKA